MKNTNELSFNEYRKKAIESDIKDLSTIERINTRLKFFYDFEFFSDKEVEPNSLLNYKERVLYYKTSLGICRIKMSDVLDFKMVGYEYTDQIKMLYIKRIIERDSKEYKLIKTQCSNN